MARYVSINSSVLDALGSLGFPTIKKAIAKPEPFTAWLKALDARTPKAPAGATKKTSRCPLSVYLQEVTGYDTIMVCVTDVLWQDEAGKVHLTPTPPWAQDFLLAIDRTNVRSHYVTAAECLAVLAQTSTKGEA